MKNIALLGSTGSIGTQALNVIRRYPEKFRVIAICANKNAELLLEQCKEFNPQFVGIFDEKVFLEYKDSFPKNVHLECGQKALVEAVKLGEVDTVVAAIVGMAGFESTYEAVFAKKSVALANKESLVAGGSVIMPLAKQNNVQILPIDSEHSAVWQCLREHKKNLKRIILTASGGAFFSKTLDELKSITPSQATRHPNWSMGKKITVDSSTMMNKGLEIIEASWLFDTQKIDYIIHPESIIHSMVEYVDGSIISQMSLPNMEHAIQLSLTYPDRLPTDLPFFDFDRTLNFFKPNEDVFVLPKLCKQALKVGGTAPCIINSANEAAVELFLNKRIGFVNIFSMVENVLQKAEIIHSPTKSDIVFTHNYWYNKLMTDYKGFIGD